MENVQCSVKLHIYIALMSKAIQYLTIFILSICRHSLLGHSQYAGFKNFEDF